MTNGDAMTNGGAGPMAGYPVPGTDGDLSGFLGCLQLADSLFPTGLYTLSYGLETFAAELPADLRCLQELLADHLRHGVALTDGIALAVAHRCARSDDLDTADLDTVERADARLSAVKLPREQREASIRVGRALLALSGRLFADPRLPAYLARVRRGTAPGNHAVVLGLVLGGQHVPARPAVATELYTVAAGFAAAAVRLGVTDHRAVQQMLHRLKPLIARLATETLGKDVDDIGGCTPLIDIMAMRHERAEVRLFMT